MEEAMNNLFRISEDGANYQARAVRAYLSMYDGIDESYNKEWHRHDAQPKISRWHNCREQGYVISMRNNDYSRQINIAFFEHRNSDQICAIEWEQVTLNPPTINNAEFCGKVYKDKYDVSYQVGCGRADEMANWIFQRLTEFWKVAFNARTKDAA
jgi:hypothetical protein